MGPMGEMMLTYRATNALLIGCIDNGPKMAKIKIELCYFTHVFRGIIQGIE